MWFMCKCLQKNTNNVITKLHRDDDQVMEYNMYNFIAKITPASIFQDSLDVLDIHKLHSYGVNVKHRCCRVFLIRIEEAVAVIQLPEQCWKSWNSC